MLSRPGVWVVVMKILVSVSQGTMEPPVLATARKAFVVGVFVGFTDLPVRLAMFNMIAGVLVAHPFVVSRGRSGGHHGNRGKKYGRG